MHKTWSVFDLASLPFTSPEYLHKEWQSLVDAVASIWVVSGGIYIDSSSGHAHNECEDLLIITLRSLVLKKDRQGHRRDNARRSDSVRWCGNRSRYCQQEQVCYGESYCRQEITTSKAKGALANTHSISISIA